MRKYNLKVIFSDSLHKINLLKESWINHSSGRNKQIIFSKAIWTVGFLNKKGQKSYENKNPIIMKIKANALKDKVHFFEIKISFLLRPVLFSFML